MFCSILQQRSVRSAFSPFPSFKFHHLKTIAFPQLQGAWNVSQLSNLTKLGLNEVENFEFVELQEALKLYLQYVQSDTLQIRNLAGNENLVEILLKITPILIELK